MIGSPIGHVNVSLSAKELVVEVYIKGTMVVSNMLLQHFWEAPYKPERLIIIPFLEDFYLITICLVYIVYQALNIGHKP